MKSESIKLEIIAWVTKLEDNRLLSSLLKLKEAAERGNWFDFFTEKEKKSKTSIQNLSPTKQSHPFNFSWEGGLKEMKSEFDGVSLQHYIRKLRE